MRPPLIRRQAQWEQDSGDKAAAARLWVVLGEWALAVSNMVGEGMVEDLVRAVRKMPAGERWWCVVVHDDA